MKNILVIADRDIDSTQALDKAINLVGENPAKIHVLAFCYASKAAMELLLEYTENGESMQSRIMQRYRDIWGERIAGCAAPVELSVEVVWEKYIHQWVREHCRRADYDAVIKTGHRSETPFYTPTDWHLFREIELPIYIGCPDPYPGRHSVMAAIDILSKNPVKQRLNQKVMRAARDLADMRGVELHCCYAVNIPPDLKDLELIDVRANIYRLEQRAREAAAPLLAEWGVPAERFHVEDGEPDHILFKYANKAMSFCIVMGTVGRSGVLANLMGNTCERLIHRMKTDMLVVSLND